MEYRVQFYHILFENYADSIGVMVETFSEILIEADAKD